MPADAGISGFQLFLRTIPYNLYAILTIAMVFYICYTGFDFGQMKLHEDNAAKGDLFTTGGEEFEQVSEQEVNPNGKVIDLVLPVAVLIDISDRSDGLHRLPRRRGQCDFRVQGR